MAKTIGEIKHMLTTGIREDLLGKATMLKVIPTVSSIVERVLGLISSTDSSFNDLNDVIKYDQSISSKIISIANSAYYSRGVEVFSLQRAMMTIGFEEVKKIVMCLLFMNDILKSLNLKGKDLVDLWKHSAYVACAARALSKKMLVEDPQKVFTISLLHDIGKTVLYINAENYHTVLKNAVEKAKDLAAMEKELYGIDHQEIGYAIGVKWRFPEEFLYAIRYHHENSSDKYDNLLKLVRASDNFALSANKDTGPEGFILLNEKDAIVAEMKKIVDFLQVV
jgi:putative nucleotidyltransferase with HDIG domain